MRVRVSRDVTGACVRVCEREREREREKGPREDEEERVRESCRRKCLLIHQRFFHAGFPSNREWRRERPFDSEVSDVAKISWPRCEA